MTSIVHVEVSGLTGSGKSAVLGEIEIALNALGLKVEHGPDFQAEKNGTHADWQQALDLYQPTVVLTERNISRQPPAREDAQPVAWAYRLNFPDENTAWDWQVEKEKMTEAKFGPHGGILETAPLYTHPDPDALRVEILREGWAAEAFNAGHTVSERRWDDADVTDEAKNRYRTYVDRKVAGALAALQAEQKGGA